MTSLTLAALFFIVIHLGLSGTGARGRAVAALGLRAYMVGFSVASLVGIIWLISAYKAAEYVPTWGMVQAWKPVMLVLMLPAFMLVVIGLATPNPTAVGQEALAASPPQGIVRITRHPFLMGVALWAGLHLVGNGDVASLLFFAAMLIVAVAGALSIDQKRRLSLGAEAWGRFAAQTSILPFAAIAGGRNTLPIQQIGVWRLVAGVAAYVIMLGGHAHLIGISPFPGH